MSCQVVNEVKSSQADREFKKWNSEICLAQKEQKTSKHTGTHLDFPPQPIIMI